jgi:peptidoglycan/LPS O-acetylase OafA/YrhL
MVLLIGINFPPVIKFAIFLIFVLPIIMLVSSVTYRLIEKPGIELGKILIKRLESMNFPVLLRNAKKSEPSITIDGQ